jgi:hypothetical protein
MQIEWGIQICLGRCGIGGCGLNKGWVYSLNGGYGLNKKGVVSKGWVLS